MDYFEYNAINPNNDFSGGKKFVMLKKASLILIAITITLFLILLPWNNEGVPTATTVFYNILIILLVELPLLGCYILFKKLASRYFEYDYFILGDMLKVVKISNKETRKSVLELGLYDIEHIGIYKSENFTKRVFENDTIISLICNQQSDIYLYLVAVADTKKTVCLIEYNVAFLTALRKAIKRESVFDIDLLIYLKKDVKTIKDNADATEQEQGNEDKK